ncbi:sugar ABC transporter ATP-binding protein [Cohnella hongkongensis]|uniref:Autoinducer 2 import ATP-binding protein LsrA n=1 Tax=Cohnella hongkongensis TaxID=178337 RepID=A0ABV9FFL2_9BACL
MEALALRNINKSFPGIKVLHNVGFSLRKGEIHALIGENGAGKSTLMNIVMGLYQPDDGEIFIGQSKVSITSPIRALALGIGIVPQELNLVPHASVAENIFLGMAKLKPGFPRIHWRLMQREAAAVMKKIGADIDVNRKVGELSAAFQQLVQIGRALAFGAEILILDEPTASLTANEAEHLFSILYQLRNEGKSIIYISHHMEEIQRISDRVSVMRDGHLIATLHTAQTTVKEMIKLMIGGEMEEFKQSGNRKGNRKELLRVSGLTRKKEFRNIEFQLHVGEIFGITGLVGAGRTELANAIYGVTSPDEGELFWDGHKVRIGSPADAIRMGIGYVPEERRKLGIFPILSVSENITMPLFSSLMSWKGIDHNEEKKLTRQYIDDLRIRTSSADKPIKLLSGGNQQKAILARWLAKKVKLLILDEPTRGIDINAKREIYELIRKMADEGMSVLLISSEFEEVIQLSDRVMVMHQGEAKGLFDSDNLTKEHILRSALS